MFVIYWILNTESMWRLGNSKILIGVLFIIFFFFFFFFFFFNTRGSGTWKRNSGDFKSIYSISKHNVAIVTIVSQPKMDSLRNFVGSFHHVAEGGEMPSIMVYGVNLRREQRREIQSWSGVTFRDAAQMDYETDYSIEEVLGLVHGKGSGQDIEADEEEHSHSASLAPKWHHFWQTLAIADAVKMRGAAVYLDASFVATSSVSQIATSVVDHGHLFSGKKGESLGCSSMIQGFVLNSPACTEILFPLMDCVLDRSCFDTLWENSRSSGFRIPKTGATSKFSECSDLIDVPKIIIEGIENGDERCLPPNLLAAKYGLRKSKREASQFVDEIVFKQGKKLDNSPLPTSVPMISTPPSPNIPSSGSVNIALLIPSTTRNTHAQNFDQLPLFTILLSTFRGTVDANDKRFTYTLYLGYDEGDAMYDSVEKQAELKKLVLEYMKGYAFDYQSQRFTGAQGAPCWIWDGLGKQAYEAGADYLYQLNDDIAFESKNWAEILVNALRSNNRLPNFGSTGPQDLNNPRILTQSFVHRTHYEIFGFYHPRVFKNWFSDDWITFVYKKQDTFRPTNVGVRNKNPSGTRYTPNLDAQAFMKEQLDEGCRKIEEYLKSKDAAQSWSCEKSAYEDYVASGI